MNNDLINSVRGVDDIFYRKVFLLLAALAGAMAVAAVYFWK